MISRRLLAAVLAGPVLLAACAQVAAPTSAPTPSPTSVAATGAPQTPAPSGGPAIEPTPVPTLEPTPAPTSTEIWRAAELRDVRTGETFRIDSLAGRLVVIEPMAIWCSNCRAQQIEARTALDRLGNAEIVYISLDIDPHEAEADLARYADESGFPWRFVVASREVARSLAQVFGDQILSPPSVPSIVINPDGSVTHSFGYHSAAELEADLAARLP